MTEKQLAELRTWAESHADAGCVQATQVVMLLNAYDARGRLALAMGERIAAQSELLSKAAARSDSQ